MTIERTPNEVIIRLPATIDVESLQQLLDSLAYKEATQNSQATQDEVDELARDVNREWWEDNRARFVK